MTDTTLQSIPVAEIPTTQGRLSLRELILSDVHAWAKIWYSQHPEDAVRTRDGLKLVWNQAGLRATLLYRLSHVLWRSRVPALPGMVARLNLTLHGLDIPPSVEIGAELYVPHPVGTVVMAKRIGNRVSLISGITIGMRHTPEFPTLGDDVFVGAGARILGNIEIGSGASIGANAVVLTDVPPGATAVGIPAKVKMPVPEVRS